MEITPRIIFEEKIAQALGKNVALVKETNAVYHFDVSGPNGGKWTLDLTKDKDWVSAGNNGTPNMIVSVADEDFMSIVAGKLNGTMAFMSGKLRLKPMDIPLATKLSKVLSSGRG